MTDLLDTIRAWIAADPDAEHRASLEALVDAGDDTALGALFAGRLAFGTAGLRAPLGPGPLRMNRLVVRQTTAGLARYLAATVPDARVRGVVVGFDARIGSDAFSRDAVGVLVAMGFRVVWLEAFSATPVTAWAVVRHGAAAGIMITASHNPPEDNGFKVYWGNGAQIIPPHDAGIARAIDAAAAAPIAFADPDGNALVQHRRDADEAEYLDAVLAAREAAPVDACAELRIAYSAMHGVGAHLVLPALARAGFARVDVVSEQIEPDGRFPTVRFPNPEEPGAIGLLLAKAVESGADLALASDPDADRLAVAIPDGAGGYTPLSGDEIGALLAADRLARTSGPRTVGTTIVSSRLLNAIAEAAGATCFRTLTGFKWIANRAMELERDGLPFVFGYEEAIGFTVGDLVRDKDGVSAALAMADLAAREQAAGSSVGAALERLRRRHGYYLTGQRTIRVDDGGAAICAGIRERPQLRLGGVAVDPFIDLADPDFRPEGWRHLPAANVLLFFLADGSRVIVRPSGTEPKVKVYLEVVAPWPAGADPAQVRADAEARLKALRHAVDTELLADLPVDGTR